jgi:hypothetical protein
MLFLKEGRTGETENLPKTSDLSEIGIGQKNTFNSREKMLRL